MAGGGRGIVETMVALEGLEGLIREKIEQERWSHAQLSDFFEAELSRSAGFQHLLSSKVLPGKEYTQNFKGD